MNILFLAIAFVLLTLSAILGKGLFKRHQKAEKLVDDELKIVLGAILSLFALLIGFILTLSINGYHARQSAEEVEAVVIGDAFQRSSLLALEQQLQAEALLKTYLATRIDFYQTKNNQTRETLRNRSLSLQTQLWNLARTQALANPNDLHASVLTAFNQLYSAQQQSMNSWHERIPMTAWGLLIMIALVANFLIGYNMRGESGKNGLILIMPIITAISLGVIAQIDAPGVGIINVVPENLKELTITLSLGQLTP